MSTTKKAITITVVESLPPNSTVWDSRVTGFGARRQRGPGISYIVYYRSRDGRQRLVTIGRHGSPWTPDTAREQARQLLGDVSRGNDPAADKSNWKKAPTVSELCDQYLADAKAGKIKKRGKAKKPSTIATDEIRVEKHIKPGLGRLKVAAVTRGDVEKLRDALEGHGAARTLGLTGAIFQFAISKNMRAENPCRGVDRPADGKRERRLSHEEYFRLGAALRDAPASMANAVAATRFIAISGWRRGEVTGLKWESIDLATRTAKLADTKTGASIRPLSRTACDILNHLTRVGDLVFPSMSNTKKVMTGYHKMWLRLSKMASLSADVSPHVLRHSFASEAFGLGLSELTIAFLLGHKKTSVTQGYIHADATLLRAADQLADHIANFMGDCVTSAKVVDLGARRV